MNKKLMYALLTGVVATGLLTACGDVEEDPAMDDEPVEEGGMEE